MMLTYKEATTPKLQEALTELGVEYSVEDTRAVLWGLYKENYREEETNVDPDSEANSSIDELDFIEEPKDLPDPPEQEEEPSESHKVKQLKELAQKGVETLTEPLRDKLPDNIRTPEQDIPTFYRKQIGKILGQIPVVGKIPAQIVAFIEMGKVKPQDRRQMQFWLKSLRNIRRMPAYQEARHELPIVAMETLYALYEGDLAAANKLFAKIPNLVQKTKANLSPSQLAKLEPDSNSWIYIK